MYSLFIIQKSEQKKMGLLAIIFFSFVAVIGFSFLLRVMGAEFGRSVFGISTVSAASSKVTEYTARRVFTNKPRIMVKGGEPTSMVVGFRNTGNVTWETYAYVIEYLPRLSSTTDSLVTSLSFADDTWKSTSMILKKEKVIAPKKMVREKFTLRAPQFEGVYTVAISLVVDDKWLPETRSIMTINVTEEAFNTIVPFLPEDNLPFLKSRLSAEPWIRIGLWESPEKIVFRSSDDVVVSVVERSEGLAKGQEATITFTKNGAKVSFDDKLLDVSLPITLTPVNDPHATFELINFDRRLKTKGTNYNVYRGKMIVDRGKKDKKLWLVNETLLEDYVAGVKETGNNSPAEYQKALQVAARSYAYNIIVCKCKYGIFDVLPSTYDQLFLGVKSEQELPSVAAASRETRGFMATYDVDGNPETPTDVVMTPYFANSNGQTKAWHTVWGGKEKLWLVPVEATYDKRDGKKLYGHGVGMSNRDAAIRADETGMSWVRLLKYYYTGVGVERWYE